MLGHHCFLVAGVVLVASACPRPAAACLCVVPDSVAAEFAAADAVFIGTVASHRSTATDGFRVTFNVEESWKGVTGRQVEVQTGKGQGDCGVPVSDGQRFIVFGDISTSGLSMSACSLTTSDSSEIEADRTAIAATGAQPIELTAGPDPQFPPPPVPFCGLGAAGGVVGTLIGLFCLTGKTQRTPGRRGR